jgi:ubiquinone/menaquinone biosynthesis C-methylase UbiE
MPDLPEQFRSILDVGCGAGQTLLSCDLQPGTLVCGIDIDEQALRYGKQLSNEINFAHASGEDLPFADQTFEVVISRVAIPYMHIPRALSEIARVLKPGGQVWFTLHSSALARRWLWKAVRKGNWKGVLYFSYVLANGWLLHWFGQQIRFPLNRTRCESFQTETSIRRALEQAGFAQVQTNHSPQFFVVKAVKD